MKGHAELVDISRLQRHLVRAHEAAAVVRKAEQLAATQPLVSASGGSVMRLAPSQSPDTYGVIVLPSGNFISAGPVYVCICFRHLWCLTPMFPTPTLYGV